jgi:hypothetical protein
VLELTSRGARLFWEMLDRADYAVTYVKCWAVDLIYGPEPPTPADRQRKAEHERLREAFPIIGLAGAIEDEEPRTWSPERSALLRFSIRHCQDRKCRLIGILTELASRGASWRA